MAFDCRLSAHTWVFLGAFVLALPFSVACADAVPSTSRSDRSPVAPWQRLSGPAEVSPPGWRKEGGVWQRIDGTPLPDSNPGQTINDLIRHQRDLETEGRGTWILATLMAYLRALDPITLASAQISAFCLLAYRVLRRE